MSFFTLLVVVVVLFSIGAVLLIAVAVYYWSGRDEVEEVHQPWMNQDRKI